ncbi:hypothetical protein [Yoonia algicola]|uniref:Uncharacterized protein n=1 Tax=Yoonia algicola TaxID=3137368 RepID=A0AAN0M1J6_9RHOB
MIDMDQNQEFSLPDMEMSVEGGNLPKFNAEVGDIETGKEQVAMDVPKIELQTPEQNAADDS